MGVGGDGEKWIEGRSGLITMLIVPICGIRHWFVYRGNY